MTLSRIAPLAGLLIAAPLAAAPYGPPTPARPAARPAPATPCVPVAPGGQSGQGDIVVCGRNEPQSDRLPLRDQRATAGEVVRHAGEAPGVVPMTHCDRPGCAEPSKMPQTLGRIIGWIKGEDPD